MKLIKLLPLTSALLFVLSGGCEKKLPGSPQQAHIETRQEPTNLQERGSSPGNVVANGIHVFSDGLPSQNYLRGFTGEIQPIVRANNEFALELYTKLRSEKGNLFLSPYSIYAALAMVCAGAQGQTEAQMIEALRLPVTAPPNAESSSTPERGQRQLAPMFGEMIRNLAENTAWVDGCELNMANALWGQKGYEFRKEFLALIQTYYGGYLQQVDFKNAAKATCTTINRWVEVKTNQKIRGLITPDMLDAMTRLVVTNAIYFKCYWEEQFNKEMTKKAPFTCADGRKIDVLMMNQTAQCGLMETEEFRVLALPYVANKLSMIILLPRKFDGLNELEKALTLGNLSYWLSKLRKCDVAVSIPKFKMTRQLDLVSALQSMGMNDVFSAKDADLSGMTGQRELFVSQVIHKAFVDVNEEGTEAAAVTGGVVVFSSSMRHEPPVFRADHPFLFLIRDNGSGSILFIGRVMDPQQ